nr:RNA-directed DNA polymerase, eukaryota [Tanacetum cinerariifolium]
MVYALDDAKSCTVVERLRLLDWFSVFRRPSRGGDELLQYTALRACTSQVTLSSQKDGIPTIVNMDIRGIDISSVLYPDCDRDVETTNHLFFSCEMAVDLWVLVAHWWELDIPITSSVLEWVTWIDTARLPCKVRNCLDAVALTLIWSIWCFRNKLLFSFTKPVKVQNPRLTVNSM